MFLLIPVEQTIKQCNDQFNTSQFDRGLPPDLSSLPLPASKNISLTLLLFIVIIGKNLIQCNGFHAGNHICFQLFVGIIQH